MAKNLYKILKEEINREVDAMVLNSPEKVKKVINELFTFKTSSLLNSLGNQEEILDEKDELPEENWEWLIDMINQSFTDNPEEWKKALKEQKSQILCYKFFTKQDFIDLEEVQKNLRFEMKRYFTALQNYSDMDNFRDKFFNLPSELLKNFVRYILNHSKKLNSEIKIDKKELKEKIKNLAEDRKKVIEKIALVSKKYQTVLELGKMKELYDCGLFFEDNFLNRGVNEYVCKLLNFEATIDKVKDVFNSVFLYDMKAQAENSAAYVKHIESIKTEEGKEYFTEKGFQVGVRFDNEIELAKNAEQNKGLVIDKESRFKEPNEKIHDVTLPWEGGADPGAGVGGEGDPEAAGAAGGDSGGGGGFGGGGSPSPSNELPGDMPETGLEGGGADGEVDPTADEGGDMPTDDDGFPVDFGTADEGGDAGGVADGETGLEDSTEEEK